MRNLLIVLFVLLPLTVFSSEFSEKFPPLVTKVDGIKEKNKADLKGKFTEVIKEISALKYNAEDEEETLMYLTYLANLCTINGDYDKSNEFYVKIVEKVPHGTFYKLMVENMLLKGDKAAADKILEAFIKKAEEIKDPEDRKRQIAEVKKAYDNIKIPAK